MANVLLLLSCHSVQHPISGSTYGINRLFHSESSKMHYYMYFRVAYFVIKVILKDQQLPVCDFFLFFFYLYSMCCI